MECLGGSGGGVVTRNQTNTPSPATAGALDSPWSVGEVIYNNQDHRSLLHMSGGWLLHRDGEGEAQRSLVYPNYID